LDTNSEDVCMAEKSEQAWPTMVKNPSELAKVLLNRLEVEARLTPTGAANRRLQVATFQIHLYVAGLEQSLELASRVRGKDYLTPIMAWAREESMRLLQIEDEEMHELESTSTADDDDL
jgi:hypothetical protein